MSARSPRVGEVRDARLAAAFPAVLVTSLDGGLLDADDAARALLPDRLRPERFLLALIADAAAEDGPVAVHTDSPPLEGVAERVEHPEGPVVVVHLRGVHEGPAAETWRRQLKLYEAVLATSPVFVHVYDRDLSSRWSSAALRPELGYQPTEPLTGEENLDFVHPDDRSESRFTPDGQLSEYAKAPRRIRVRAADGAYRWLSLLSVDMLDDPDIGSVVIHAWDIDDEVAREAEIDLARRRLSALIDTLDEAVVVVSDGVVAYANARLVEFFPPVAEIDAVVGQSPEALHEALSEAMADPDAFVAAGLNAIAEGRAVRGRFVETTDGRILEQHFIPIRDGDRMWVYRDVTARLQVERRQAKLLRLERRARRAAEEQNDRLRELDELKTAFVATVSHELRTPLSALTSYIDLLLDPGGDPLSEQQRRIAGSAYRGAERLARLVDDLLVLARLQSRTLEVHAEPVDVGEAVSEAVEEVVRAAGADVEIDADIAQRGPRVVGDHERITQVVANLLGNARKFAAERVEVHARADAAGWTIDVADDGPGVAPDELARVFEPFFRGRDAVAGHRPGTGLGLAISAQLVDLLGGTLTLENRDEGGARARLVLPIGEPS